MYSFHTSGECRQGIAKKTINAASVRFGVAARLDLLPDDSLRENERFSRSLSVMSFGVSIYLVDQPTEGLMPKSCGCDWGTMTSPAAGGACVALVEQNLHLVHRNRALALTALVI